MTTLVPNVTGVKVHSQHSIKAGTKELLLGMTATKLGWQKKQVVGHDSSCLSVQAIRLGASSIP